MNREQAIPQDAVDGSVEMAQFDSESSYRQLHFDRILIGVSRLSMGVNLAILFDSGGWRGRTGAKSFRRFLIEEGIEPKAATQYIQVARAFIIGHKVDPRRIALVSMRLLVQAAKYLTPATVDEVVNVLSQLPAAEAKCALEESFGAVPTQLDPTKPLPLSPAVHKALHALEEMTFEERSDFYRAVHIRSEVVPAAQVH